MANHKMTPITGKFQTLKISEVFIPEEMNNLYDYTNREIEIETLKTSIEEFGQLQPVLVVKKNDKVIIINGVLRYEALLRSEKNEIDAIIVDFKFEDEVFTLNDLIIHSQIQKVKSPKEKMREFISILRIKSGDENALRDRNERYNFLTKSLGKGWSRSNVILMMNVIKWTIENNDHLNIVEQVFEEKILVSQAAFVTESLARDDYNFEKEGESKILKNYLRGDYKKEKAEKLIDIFNYKRNEGFSQIDLYPLETENYKIIKGSLDKVKLPSEMKISTIFTSSPYYRLRKYGDDPNEFGWEATPQKFAERLIDSLMVPYANLEESGNLFLNLGETYDNGKCLAVIEHVVLEAVKRGMFYVDRIIWVKESNKPISNQNHRFLPGYEVVLHFAKSKNYYFNRFKIKKDVVDYSVMKGCKEYGWKGVNYFVPNFYKQLRNVMSENELRDMIKVQINSERIKHVEGEEYHPATFSQMLPAIFLATYTPKPTEDYKPLVFDPFLGGASCGRTALMMGYKFAGVELYETNVETSRRVLGESMIEFEPRALEYLETQKEYELVA
jgi:DNA modification methylase